MDGRNRLRRRALHGATAASFLAVALFFIGFVLLAPGRYQPHGWPDAALALLLLGNEVCVLLSLRELLRLCRQGLRSGVGLKWPLGELLLDGYPLLLTLALCAWDPLRLAQWAAAPFRMLLALQ